VTKLSTEGLTRRFLGLVAVNDVSFSMAEGEILGIIGPNGAGKTTFINLVSGIVMPSAGRIEYKGKDITYAPAHERARMGIARTYQLIHPLENLTLIENVMVGSIFARGNGLKEARRKAEALCAELGLSGLDRDTTRLTILEIKKMEIARALATSPRSSSWTRSWPASTPTRPRTSSRPSRRSPWSGGSRWASWST